DPKVDHDRQDDDRPRERRSDSAAEGNGLGQYRLGRLPQGRQPLVRENQAGQMDDRSRRPAGWLSRREERVSLPRVRRGSEPAGGPWPAPVALPLRSPVGAKTNYAA